VADPKPTPPSELVQYRLAEALKAHARGWAITPAHGKSPFRKGWSSEPPPDKETIETWAVKGNIGVRTGSVSGIFVIDDDSQDGSAAAALNLPSTPTVITGSGKRHHYFRMPQVPLGNSASKLALQVDTRGDGGMVVAVGSVHPDTGEKYAWAPGLSPDDVPLADLPEHVIKLLTKGKSSATEPVMLDAKGHDLAINYSREHLRRRAAALGRAAEGVRNELLNKSAFTMGRYVGAGLLERSEVEGALRSAALAAGLGESETDATIRSGIEAGQADPCGPEDVLKKARRARERDLESDVFVEPKKDPRGRPVIELRGGELPQIVDAAELAMLKDGGAPLYQRESTLVRMVRSSSSQIASGIRRPAGALVLILIEIAYLVERFTRAACFQKFDGRSGEMKIVDCPERVGTTYLARRGTWRVPVLRGVVEAPTLRPDGSILQTPGYDKETGIFFDPGAVQFLPVPENRRRKTRSPRWPRSSTSSRTSRSSLQPTCRSRSPES
jgi:hypothetical protein